MFKIKTYSSKALNLDEKYAHLKFQLYQKVFHIYFIPVYPIEKFWVVKDSLSNENTVTDAYLRTKLNLIELKKRSPLWSYSGSIILLLPILFLIGLLVYNFGGRQFDKINENLENKKVNREEIIRIKNPALNDLYHIKMFQMIPKKNQKGFKKQYQYSLKYKLINFYSDSIQLTRIKDAHNAFNVKLMDTVTIAQKDLITVSDKYKTLKIYETIKKNNSVKAEAVFLIHKITSPENKIQHN